MKVNKKVLDDTEIEKAIKEADATLAIEGLKASNFTKQVYRQFAKGEITEEEALQKLKENVMSDVNRQVVEYEIKSEPPLFIN